MSLRPSIAIGGADKPTSSNSPQASMRIRRPCWPAVANDVAYRSRQAEAASCLRRRSFLHDTVNYGPWSYTSLLFVADTRRRALHLADLITELNGMPIFSLKDTRILSNQIAFPAHPNKELAPLLLLTWLPF